MKINELKRIAKENDYEYEMRHFQYKLKKMQGTNCITISNDVEKTLWISNKSWCDKKDFNMIKAAVEFAETPINEREEEKKFYLKHRWLSSRFKDKIVNKDEKNEYFLSDESQADSYKIHFTLKEIEDIKKRFNTDLKDFEMIEVEQC